MTASSLGRRRAFTLLELIVVITMLGIMTAVATLATRRIDRPKADDPLQIIADSQQVALATGRTIVTRIIVDSVPRFAAIHADGSIIGDSLLEIERLTGTAAHARR